MEKWRERQRDWGKMSRQLLTMCLELRSLVVLLDGVDLSAMLRGNGTAAADRCSFFYGGTPGAGCAGHGHKGEGGRRNASVSASAIAACPGLWAVRCGAFKGHWVTRNGQRVQPKVQRLLFDVVNDPAEAHELREKLVAEHKAPLAPRFRIFSYEDNLFLGRFKCF